MTTAVLASAAVAVLLAIVFVVLRAKQRSVFGRAALLVGMILTVLLAPWMVDFLVRRLNYTAGIGRIYIDEGPLAVWLPSLVAALCAAVVGVRQAKRDGG